MRYNIHVFIAVILTASVRDVVSEQVTSAAVPPPSFSSSDHTNTREPRGPKNSRVPYVSSSSSSSSSSTSGLPTSTTTETDFQTVQSNRRSSARRKRRDATSTSTASTTAAAAAAAAEQKKKNNNNFAMNYFGSNSNNDNNDNQPLFDSMLNNMEEDDIYNSAYYDGADAEYSDEENDYKESIRPSSKNASGGDDSDDDDHMDYGKASEKGALYDAYNLLHTLAQDFKKPFDAPAVVVVGHQSSGKSALIEALMGFQFNQVGGGTKTRRPIALRMQYNPQCSEPICFLQGSDGIERPKSLSEIQEYIQAENTRLERDPVRSFESREINVRMEYKYCPNMILIDTPGLIAAPRIPKGRNRAGASNTQQRALQKIAREAERLVVEKMRCPDYIILCVEDTMDWKHGATREIVQKADPDLSRTIIVNTKLDTKVPQFGTPTDLVDFLRAQIIDTLSPQKLGGPYFTSVPSGRVGRPQMLPGGSIAEDYDDYIFNNDDDFVKACIDNEKSDRSVVWERLKRMNRSKRAGSANNAPTPANLLLPRVGVTKLRGFLEQRVDDCYRRNVAKIVPLLQAEHASASKRLKACETELEALSVERLKAGAESFCDDFCKALKDAIQGSIIAPSGVYGETVEQERLAAGSFHEIAGRRTLAITDSTWDQLVDTEVGNVEHRLYGGAQYHRAMREFNLAAKCLKFPMITQDEIANAAGMGDVHDGVNFLRAACVIALEKAQTSFDPLLDALRLRMIHVLGKISPISEYILNERKDRAHSDYAYYETTVNGGNSLTMKPHGSDISQNPQFRQLVRTIYDQFVQKCSDSTMMRCRDDLYSLTKFVAWDLHERSSGAIRRSLPDHTDMVAVYQVALQATSKETSKEKDNNKNNKSDKSSDKDVPSTAVQSSPSVYPVVEGNNNRDRDYYNLLQIIEEAASSRDANRTNLVVGGLVQHIIGQWRETFARTVTTKFNCYFMLPFVDEFSRFLREELQKIYEGEGEELCDIFNLAAARRTLKKRRDDLMNECMANKRLQEKFNLVAKMMRIEQESSGRTKL